MIAPLLHLTDPAGWRAALARGAVAPLPGVGFVHLSTPEQVVLPADRLFHGRDDLLVLVLEPARIGVEVRFEPGVPTDPASLRFPHAYGPVPVPAVLAVLPYRPRPDGGFDAPALPGTDPAGRLAVLEPALLRRAATAEIPVTGGVGVLTAPVPASHQHNQLLVDGAVDAGELSAEADRVLGGAGLTHRRALLTGAHLARTAGGLAEHGWAVDPLVGMVAPAGGTPDPRVEPVDLEALRPGWDAMWRRDLPGVDAGTLAELTDRYRTEEPVSDLRYLAVREAGGVVARCVLKIDGATALLDAVHTDPAHRGRGYGDALVTTALAVAAEAGCDLVGLQALAHDWPRHWYRRRGFVAVTRGWTAQRA